MFAKGQWLTYLRKTAKGIVHTPCVFQRYTGIAQMCSVIKLPHIQNGIHIVFSKDLRP